MAFCRKTSWLLGMPSTQHKASISYIAIPEAATLLKKMKKLVPSFLITRNHEKKNICNSRESNPGLIRGRDLSYHLTTIAPILFFEVTIY